MQPSEEALIAKSISGDADAYGQLVDRYKNALYRHSFALMRDEDTAEDIAQEAFIAAYYKLDTFDSSKRFSTWLFKIATNKALDSLRSRRRVTPMDDTVLERIVSPHAAPEQSAVHSELATAVAELEPRYRAVVHLYYFEGMSYDEIAVVMAKPVGSIKGWMNRAKKQLRKELA